MIEFKDRDNRRRLGAEQKHLQDLLNIALGLADEVGNPLTAVDGAIDLLHQCWREQQAKGMHLDVEEEQQVKACFAILREQTDRIGQVLQELRSFNVLSGMQPALSDLNEILQAVITLTRLDKQGDNVRFQTDFDPHIPALMLERSAMVSCMLPLLACAVEVGRKNGGIVHLSTRANGDWVSLVIENQAIDAAACQSGQCFSPFCPNGHSPNCTDIDLTFIRSIIEKQAGKFTVYCVPEKTCGITLELPSRCHHNAIAV